METLPEKRRFYEQAAKIKGDTDVYWAAGFFQSLLIEKINSILQDVHRKRVIDIGCGDGRTTLFLAERENLVIGIDISRTRLSRAQQKIVKYAFHTQLVQAYAEAFPVKQEKFDVAVCIEVLEHVVNDDALLQGLASVLKPNAWVLLSIPTVSLGRYFDMWYLGKPIYGDPLEHIREFSYYNIPWFENDFILIKNLERKFNAFGLNVMKRYGIGFELPIGLAKFRLGQLMKKVWKNKRINKIISSLPILRNVAVYTIFILQKGQQYA